MKKIVLSGFAIVLCMLIIPLCNIKSQENDKTPEAVQTSVTVKQEKKKENKTEAEVFRVKTADGIKEIPHEDYVVGVVAAEMPSSYNIEALKAQSVAAYTFALYKSEKNAGQDYDLTDSYETDQSYLSEDKLREKWGEEYETKIEIIKRAVSETKGEYLSFDGSPALTLYHAVSSGVTNACADVFGGDIPYLKPVQSEWDKLSPDYKSVFSFSEDELTAKLAEIKKATVSGNLFSEAQEAISGAVKKIKYSGEVVSGSKVCSLLGLPSPNFTVEYSGGAYSFTCLGKGHGVGMSQYGAGQMALTGSDYRQILAHYYPGTELQKNT